MSIGIYSEGKVSSDDVKKILLGLAENMEKVYFEMINQKMHSKVFA